MKPHVPITAALLVPLIALGPACATAPQRQLRLAFIDESGSASEEDAGVVEQNPGNLRRFGPERIHTAENVVPLEKSVHNQISAFYSRIVRQVTGSDTLTVRKWLSTQSFEEQREFGLKILELARRGRL